jgi:PBSX family phage terminase large subunit
MQQRARAELELRKRERAREAEESHDPRTPPTFRGAALQAQSIVRHEWMLAGPAETGKTFAALFRLDHILRTHPFARGALIRKVRADILPTVLATYLQVIAWSGSGAVPFGGRDPEWFDYPNGARLYIGGMDRPGKVLSGERDVVYINQAEELTLDDFETLTTRVTGRGAVVAEPMIFGDCNPGPPSHWIINRPSLAVLYSRHEDNPTLFDDVGNLTKQGERTIAILDRLTGVRHKRLRLGLWVAAEGTVYEEYDRSIHLIDPFDIPDHWRRIRVIDFGYTNAFVCHWWAIDYDGRMYLYREIYMTKRTVTQHAKRINELSEGESIEVTICDHDADDRATLEECGIPNIAAYKNVARGIGAVKDRLVKAEDGKPRMFIFKDCLVEVDTGLQDKKLPYRTEDEWDSYVWADKTTKEVPVKVNDHGLDTARYAVAYADRLHDDRKEVWIGR